LGLRGEPVRNLLDIMMSFIIGKDNSKKCLSNPAQVLRIDIKSILGVGVRGHAALRQKYSKS
jgi:hypothetical protein